VEQKRAEGTLRAKDSQVALVVGGRGAPKPSAYLTKSQQKRFRALVAELADADFLDYADRGMIELAAIEEDNIAECNRFIDANGVVITGGMGGTIANPAVTKRAQSITSLRQLYAELGIGPASRARLQNLGIDKGKPPEKGIPSVAKFAEARARLRAVGDE
jgi:P27 family predicted phage terminase small subunit